LGLMTPLAVNAAEINLNGISDYAPTIREFQDASKLSDIHPSDWAFKALSEIRNSRGCNVSMPIGVMTRAEAAALLNKCIQNAAKLNESELRLVDEFSIELATLKGTQEVENSYSFDAGQFSTTTTLSGSSNMVVGGVNYDGSPVNQKVHGFYGYGLDLNTSFTGEDLLYAGIATGSFDETSTTGSELGGLDFAETGSGTLSLGSLFYSFPLKGATITAGPLLDQDDVVTATTSVYSDAFKLGANPFTLPGNTGIGAAVAKSFDGGWNLGASVIATNGEDASQGILTYQSEDIVTLMGGYDGEVFGAGLIYTALGDGDASTSGYSAFGGGIYVRPEGWPTLSFAYDTKEPESAATETSTDWLVGVDWQLGPGTASFAMSNIADTDANDDDELEYEFYYAYPVSDYITITPGFFIIEKDGTGEDTFGVAVNTNFVF